MLNFNLYTSQQNNLCLFFNKINKCIHTLILQEENDDTNGNSGISVWDNNDGNNNPSALDAGPYGDYDSRIFYEDLPDLLTIIPLPSLGITPEQV